MEGGGYKILASLSPDWGLQVELGVTSRGRSLYLLVITDMKKIVIINKMKKYEEILHNKIPLLYMNNFSILFFTVYLLF